VAYKIIPAIAPFIRAIFGQDDSDDFRVLRTDIDGGLLAGDFGGYHGVYREQVSVGSGAGGTTSVETTAVPAGYLHVYQSVIGWQEDTVARLVGIQVVASGSYYYLNLNPALAPLVAMSVSVPLVLAPGEKLRMYGAALAGDKWIFLAVVGYTVRLT